jgi:ubiquinone/menaquinone biosynthesis C-methylase UbiE
MIDTAQPVNYHEVEATIKADYREATVQYRRDDEIEVGTENHRHLASTLKKLCRSFSHPVKVLDVGCGTGRYFHCLENVAQLTGMDISEEMLAAARDPVRSNEITAKNIALLRGNVYLQSFPPESFHVIYSLGMFGHGCPVTVEICDKFHRWLRPGGRIFFNLVDFGGLPLWYRARRQLRDAIYPILGKGLRAVLDKREQRSPFFSLTKQQLEQVMLRTRFRSSFSVVSQRCRSPLWNGRHLECLAAKDAPAHA